MSQRTLRIVDDELYVCYGLEDLEEAARNRERIANSSGAEDRWWEKYHNAILSCPLHKPLPEWVPRNIPRI